MLSIIHISSCCIFQSLKKKSWMKWNLGKLLYYLKESLKENLRYESVPLGIRTYRGYSRINHFLNNFVPGKKKKKITLPPQSKNFPAKDEFLNFFHQKISPHLLLLFIIFFPAIQNNNVSGLKGTRILISSGTTKSWIVEHVYDRQG